MSYRRWVLIGGGIILLIVIIVIWRVTSQTQAEVPTHTVSRGAVNSTVEFTGHLQAEQTAKLGFESVGVARQVNVEVGDQVAAGQRLAVLDTNVGELEVAKASADYRSAVATAQTGLATAQSALQATQATNTQTITQAEQAVRNAKRDWDQAKKVWEQTVAESGDESSLTQTRYSTVVSAESAYKSAQAALKVAQATAKKTSDAAQAAVTTAQTALLNTQQAAANRPGPSSLEAMEQLARLRLSKTVLTAPFAGVVTEKKIESGEIAVAGTPLITIQTVQNLEVIADVAETDVTKLKVGQTAEITLDAYPISEKWSAEVTNISPSATVLQGVPTYQVTLQLRQADERLRPGLTANVVVQTEHKDNVVFIPRRAIISADGKQWVVVIKPNSTTERRQITTGLAGADGQIEVTSGLTADEQIQLRPSPTP
jgi:HlyD family secretion protein